MNCVRGFQKEFWIESLGFKLWSLGVEGKREKGLRFKIQGFGAWTEFLLWEWCVLEVHVPETYTQTPEPFTELLIESTLNPKPSTLNPKP